MAVRADSVHDSSVHWVKIVPRDGVIAIQAGPGMSRPDAPMLDVIFEGVVAHHFQGTLIENVLFDIEEIALDDFLSWNREELTEHLIPGVLANTSWQNVVVAAESLRSRGIRAFSISASLGMSGWILCTQCRRVHCQAVPVRDRSTT